MSRVILSASLLMLGTLLVAGCSTNNRSSAPSDFFFLMDTRSADKGTTQHINIRINAKGKAEYDIYESGGVIQHDLNDIVTYNADQIVSRGRFKLSKAELSQLWDTVNTNGFFDLSDDYRMALGHSYAFILIKANGIEHMVDNIGVEVPEIRALVEAMSALIPDGLDLEYGEGILFEK